MVVTKLAVPPGVMEHPESLEVFRAWLCHRRLYISVNTELWEDPAAYGLMLADISQHVSNALAHATGKPREVISASIANGILAQIEDDD